MLKQAGFSLEATGFKKYVHLESKIFHATRIFLSSVKILELGYYNPTEQMENNVPQTHKAGMLYQRITNIQLCFTA